MLTESKLLHTSQDKQLEISHPEQAVLCEHYSISRHKMKVPQNLNMRFQLRITCVCRGYCKNVSFY